MSVAASDGEGVAADGDMRGWIWLEVGMCMGIEGLLGEESLKMRLKRGEDVGEVDEFVVEGLWESRTGVQMLDLV